MTQRYLMKGGYWKNSEDEILKAAVIKYGFNQWSRISSLIARKSAKQCKARWYEWLDPSIKKTEWTREEEEKLLHLAKIFPSQWRTIAPVVGRTPAQCVEHYERLLDQAQGRDTDPENDPRKLKPGEIDPTPEIRPARADARDMDDDEKEMIAESRVRLANIKGKKAKRRAREKFIERSKQMAQLQKQRELKAAGIEYIIERKKKKKRVEIDYNAEIPFEARPVEILYKTGDEENPAPKKNMGNISINQLEGPRRDLEEKRQRKLDQQKMKKLRNMNLPAYIDKTNRKNPLLYQKKTKLILSEPQLTDKDLNLLAKMTKSTAESNIHSQSAATRGLVGNYSIRDPTPMRTPKYSTQILQEVRNVHALSEAPSPMVGAGGELTPNPELDEALSGSKKSNLHTPNPYKAMLQRTPRSALRGDTPLSSTNRGRTPMMKNFNLDEFSTDEDSKTSNLNSKSQTPILYNDELNLNDNEWTDSVWEDKLDSQSEIDGNKFNEIRTMIKNCIKSLPQPKNQYDFDLPELEEFKARELALRERTLVKDASEVKKLVEREEHQAKIKNLLKRSQSVRMCLPRPAKLNETHFKKLQSSSKNPFSLVEREMIQMIINDAVDYPQKDKILSKRDHNSLIKNYNNDLYEEFEIEQLEQAEMLIEDEVQKILHEQNLQLQDIEKISENTYLNQFKQDWSKVKKGRKTKGRKKSSKSKEEKTETQIPNLDFSKTNEQLESEYTKINSTIDVLSKDIQNVTLEEENNKVVQEISDLKSKIKNKEIELEVYTQLKSKEGDASVIRMREIDQYTELLREKESALQRTYQSLKNQIEDLVENELEDDDEEE